tara:strand:- start:151 stop:2316 length:2166 start_codon:yes stop_codon:yes gene_type:complete
LLPKLNLPSPNSDIAEVDLRFFQFNDRLLRQFAKFEVSNFGSLCAECNTDQLPLSLKNRLSNVWPHLQEDGTFDFENFYRKGTAFNQLFLKMPSFDDAIKKLQDVALEERNFGKSIFWLKQNDIHTYGDLWVRLTDGIESKEGLGSLKLELIWNAILDAADKPEVSIQYHTKEAPKPSIHRIAGYINTNFQCSKLSPQAACRPLTELHMGSKVATMNAFGIYSLEDLWQDFNQGLRPMKFFGLKSLSHAVSVSTHISSSLNPNGDINWGSFCDHASIPHIPMHSTTSSGEQFLELIPLVLQEVIEASADPAEKDILTHRLTKSRNEQKTLREIGAFHGISRERIRQKESRVLAELSNSLLYGEYKNLEYRFKPDYCHYFQLAANALMGVSEITLNQFLRKLSETWSVSVSSIIVHASFITAVLTNKAMTSPEMNAHKALPPLLHEELPSSIHEIALHNFSFHKYLDVFLLHNISTFGEAVDKVKADSLPIPQRGRAFQLLNQVFESIEKLLRRGFDPNQNWKEQYAELNQIPWLPASGEVLTVEDFLESIKPTLRELLNQKCYKKYSIEIFDLRLSVKKDERLTANLTGDKTGAHGSGIKTCETQMLKQLHQQLIDKDHRDVEVFFHDSFLTYWQQADSIYQANQDFTRFHYELAKHWKTTAKNLDDYIDLIWSVLNLYPHGRNYSKPKGRQKRSAIEQPHAPRDQKSIGIIKLRGFKRVY